MLPMGSCNSTLIQIRVQEIAATNAHQIDSKAHQYYKERIFFYSYHARFPAKAIFCYRGNRMTSTSQAYDEKRIFIRMKVDTPIIITLTGDDSNKEIEAICKDLSGDGMLVEINEQLPLGAEVAVRIKSGKNPFTATGEVTRIKSAPSGSFIHGLKLKEVNQ